MITAPETARKVDAYWAAYFGCAPEDLKSGKTLVVTHVALEGYDGALIFRTGDACIVSVPRTTPEIERRKLREAKPDQVFDPKFLARVFVVNTDKVTGPAWVATVKLAGLAGIQARHTLGSSAEGPAVAVVGVEYAGSVPAHQGVRIVLGFL